MATNTSDESLPEIYFPLIENGALVARDRGPTSYAPSPPRLPKDGNRAPRTPRQILKAAHAHAPPVGDRNRIIGTDADSGAPSVADPPAVHHEKCAEESFSSVLSAINNVDTPELNSCPVGQMPPGVYLQSPPLQENIAEGTLASELSTASEMAAKTLRDDVGAHDESQQVTLVDSGRLQENISDSNKSARKPSEPLARREEEKEEDDDDDDKLIDRKPDDVSPRPDSETEGGAFSGYITLRYFTEENLESQIGRLKRNLELLRTAPDLLTDSQKYEKLFRLQKLGMKKYFNPNVAFRVKLITTLLDNGLSEFVMSYWNRLNLKSHKQWYLKKGNRMTCCLSFHRLLAVVVYGVDLGHSTVLATVTRELMSFALAALDTDVLYTFAKKLWLQILISKGLLGLLQGIVRRHDGGCQAVRDSDGVRIVGRYVAHTKHAIKTKAILVLGQLITEDDQKHLLESSDGHIKYLLDVLKNCVAGGEDMNYHSEKYGYSAEDVLDGLNRIASLDSNKPMIVKMGALPLYVNFMADGCSPEVQTAACQGIWTLAFCKENRDLFTADVGCMTELQRLSESLHPSVKKAALGALWIIEGEEKRVQVLSSEEPALCQKAQHIMLSYNWAVQDEVIKVRDRLRASGFDIWMDIEQMSGSRSTLEAMAKSIEDASVVLIFFSEKYKMSASCRSEAEYTYKLGKEYIPIRMQEKYAPDGWLGILLGTRFFFDLSKPGRWEQALQALIKQLQDVGKCHTDTKQHAVQDTLATNNTEVVSSHETYRFKSVHQLPTVEDAISTKNRMVTIEDRKLTKALPTRSAVEPHSWTSQKVKDWLRENQLAEHADRFASFTGRHLLELRRVLLTAPDYCYGVLEQQLGLRLPDVLTFTMALRDLNE